MTKPTMLTVGAESLIPGTRLDIIDKGRDIVQHIVSS